MSDNKMTNDNLNKMNTNLSFREEKELEEKNRIKSAIIKSVSRVAVCFSVGILIISIMFTIGNIWIEPVQLLKIWIGFFVLVIVNFFRLMVASSKWAMGKPFILTNLLFMPLYLATALVLAMDLIKDIEGLPKGWMLVLYAGIFLIVFSVKQFIEYFSYKAKTDLMNDALTNFQKEHKWDEEE